MTTYHDYADVRIRINRNMTTWRDANEDFTTGRDEQYTYQIEHDDRIVAIAPLGHHTFPSAELALAAAKHCADSWLAGDPPGGNGQPWTGWRRPR